MTTRQAVDKLLQQYGDYKKRAEAIQNVKRTLAKQKLAGAATTEKEFSLFPFRDCSRTVESMPHIQIHSRLRHRHSLLQTQ